jgi:hypothetical protein
LSLEERICTGLGLRHSWPRVERGGFRTAAGLLWNRTVSLLLPVVVFAVLMGGFYTLIGRSRPMRRRDGFALMLGLAATVPLLRGGTLLLVEQERWQHGRVSAGVVVAKLSSSGEAGTQTIGGSRRWRRPRPLPSIVTSRGFTYDDMLARLLLTGSADAWMVEYRAPCEARGECRTREFVSHDRWSALQVGQPVNVRTADPSDSGRLDDNPQWPTGFALTGIGAVLALCAGLVSGRLLRRRTRYETAAGVVLGVEAVRAGEWRVRFGYVTADGTTRESVDRVFVEGVKPGDDCVAIYPQRHPGLAALQLPAKA